MPFDPYISEIRYMGSASSDFIEIALDNGADPSTISLVVYHPNGAVRSINSLAASPDATIAGTDVYTVATGVHRNGAVALVQDGNVLSFISFNQPVTANSGPAAGLTSTQIGTSVNGQSLASTDHGATYSVDNSPDPGVIPCFVTGTLIATPGGERPVEELCAGDEVLTADHGAQPLIWAGASRLTGSAAAANAPLCIPPGAFGRNQPARALQVSPAHRVLIGGSGVELATGDSEALIPANQLLGWNGIAQMPCRGAIWYHHLLLERHEIVFANNLPSESFHPAEATLKSFHRFARREIERQFPGPGNLPADYGPTARPCLRRFETHVVTQGWRRAA